MLLALLLTATTPRYIVTYQPGGETALQAQKRVGGVAVIAGGYYATAKGVRHSIDLVIVEGKVVIPYRSDLARPVLTVEKDGTIRLDKQYRPSDRDWYAVAGASVPADKDRPRPRQIIIVEGNTLRFKFMTGSYDFCESRLKGQRHIYMDGGSSAAPSARLPSHIVQLY